MDVGTETLRDVIERVLLRARGEPVDVAAVAGAPSPFATLFPVEVLSVALASGERLSLFSKLLGDEEADHPDKQRRDREIRVYEELLDAPGLPVPAYFGSDRDPATGRCRVFLEYISDWSLEYQDLSYWVMAARRLGQLHAHFASERQRLHRCEFLLAFDTAYFVAWAERARATVAARCPALAADLGRALAECGPALRLVTSAPTTLVHNDPAPKNVLADRSSVPARICFVDWEMAGVGCGVLDLVDFKYGVDPHTDAEMRVAYREGVAGSGLLPPSDDDEDRLHAACEFHKILYRLAHATTWNVPLERMAAWVADADVLVRRV